MSTVSAFWAAACAGRALQADGCRSHKTVVYTAERRCALFVPYAKAFLSRAHHAAQLCYIYIYIYMYIYIYIYICRIMLYIYIYIHILLYIYILPMPYMPCTGIQSRIYMLPMPYRTCTGIQSRIQMPPVPYKRRIRSCRASVSSIVYIEGSLRIRVDVCRFALQMGTILRRCGVAGSAERPAARAWPVLAWWTAAD